MKTEKELATLTVERTASLRLLQTIDLDAVIAKSSDGTVSVEALQAAGDFVIEVTPNGRNATKDHVEVDDEVVGDAWLAGFKYCADMKKKGARKPKANGAAKTTARKKPAAKSAATK